MVSHLVLRDDVWSGPKDYGERAIPALRTREKRGARVAWLSIAAFLLVGSLTLAASPAARAKGSDDATLEQTVQQLVDQVRSLQARVKELENAQAAKIDRVPSGTPEARGGGEVRTALVSAAPKQEPQEPPEPMDHEERTMDLPGGPKLNIRGFLDFNFGVGTAANALIYPLSVPPTPAIPIHDTFQFGEFDLFMNSELSNSISFLSEVVFGSDASNFWGIDIERAQITYKPSDFFQLSAGRMHTAIGYYNTAYHHGTWFQTATGRPYMYFFEDSGGILPVHIVGLEAAGLVPGSGKLNAHWNFQVGNGVSSLFIGQPIMAQPVQNFLSDKDHKAFNIAGYIKPDRWRGLQIGANYYHDERVPTGAPRVNNSIVGAYLVYNTPTWEFLNEFQLQRNHAIGSGVTYNTPLGYTQISHKFGNYRPYFRWQEVNVPVNDPLYSTVGRYEGPSVGLRMDFTGYAAFKVQYNRIYTRDALPKNGVDSQVSFTF